MSRTALTRSILAAMVLAAATPVAFGATFCATNGTQLQSYLNTAASNNESDEIKLTLGSFTASPGPNGYLFEYISNSSHDLVMSGGWTEGCGAPTNFGNLTTLDGQDAHAVLRFDLRGGSLAEITVRGVTIANGLRGAGTIAGAGLEVYSNSTTSLLMNFDRLVVRDNVHLGSDGAVRFLIEGDGQFNLTNFLVTGNATESNAAMVITQWFAGSSVRMNQSTITDNHRQSGGNDESGGFKVVGSGTSNSFFMFNNVIWGNYLLSSMRDVEFESMGFNVARNNHIGYQQGSHLIESDRSTGNPDWTVDQNG